MDSKSKIFLIYGPTASGKSNFALKLAKKIEGEIVNADSMQVYKELKILSARPSKNDCKNIKHHLYGFQTAKKSFSTGDWLKLTNKKILDIKKRKKVPIIVGGTGLYFKSLTEGLVDIPAIPIKFRQKIRSLHKSLGSKKFFIRLITLDPMVKNRINPFDTQRAIRAYEIKLFTNKSIFEWFKNTNEKYEEKNFYKICIDIPRDKLISRINSRSKKMIEMGLILEVKKFLQLKVSKDKTASKAIGLNEVKEYVDKKIKISEVIDKISIKTRQYAKRQSTWARGNMVSWKKLNQNDLNKFLKKI